MLAPNTRYAIKRDKAPFFYNIYQIGCYVTHTNTIKLKLALNIKKKYVKIILTHAIKLKTINVATFWQFS